VAVRPVTSWRNIGTNVARELQDLHVVPKFVGARGGTYRWEVRYLNRRL